MKSAIKAFCALGIGAVGCVSATAQQLPLPPSVWSSACLDPDPNATPYSNPYDILLVQNELFVCTLGVTGTVAYGGGNNGGGNPPTPPSPCYNPGVTLNVPGKFAFQVGRTGSLQKTSRDFIDDYMALNLGAWSDPGYCFANVRTNGTGTYWGDNVGNDFSGESNRYMTATQAIGNFTCKLTIELVADVIRFRWRMTNNSNAPDNVGLWFGGNISMLTENAGITSTGGNNASGSANFNRNTNDGRSFKPIFVYVPTVRPPTQDVLFDRTIDPTNFPKYADFLFGQTDAFGFRLETEPSLATEDIPANEPTRATRIILGQNLSLLGNPGQNSVLKETVREDRSFLGNPAFVEEFPEQTVQQGTSTQILYYVRSPWGTGNYALPYGMVVDAPRLVTAQDTDFDGNPSPTGLTPNPMTIRVWLDNVGGFGTVGREFPLNDIRVRLSFADSGITIVGSALKTISNVEPRLMSFVDFTAKVADDFLGDEKYVVTIDSQPGNVHKQVTGNIRVAMRPSKRLYQSANLITAPFVFQDSSWESVLQNFGASADPNSTVRVYTWDPVQQGYVISLGAQRGVGAWVIYNGAASSFKAFGGNPSTPVGYYNRAPVLQLRSGWNLIGNPYNYNFPINQLLGVSAADPQTSHTFSELVALGFVANYVAYWDPVKGQYVYVDGTTGEFEPGKGYWMNVLTEDPLSLQFPQLGIEGLPDSPLKMKPTAPVSKVASSTWKLALKVQDSNSSETATLGTGSSTADVNRSRIYKAPASPVQTVSIFTVDTKAKTAANLQQELKPASTHMVWNVSASNANAGAVTISWPEASLVTRSISLKLKDMDNSVVTDMRFAPNYTYQAKGAGIHKFQVIADVFGPTSATIGDISVSIPAGTAKPTSVTVNYKLLLDAKTQVNILNSRGDMVATLVNSDQTAGAKTAVWNLRSGVGTAVPSGSYYVQVLAQTSSGNRAQKTYSFTVR